MQTNLAEPKRIHSCHFWNSKLLPRMEEVKDDRIALQSFQRIVTHHKGALATLQLIHGLIDEDTNEMNLALWELSETDGKINGAYEKYQAVS